MSKPDLTKQSLPYFVERLNKIQSADQRKWGELSPAALMRHLRAVTESSLGGEPKVEDKSKPLLRVLIRWLFFEVFTQWPGGKIKVPKELTPEPEHDLDQERRDLIESLERFVAEAEKDPERKELSLLLGPLPLRYFAHIHGLHFHHHFRQYGVV